jgi:Phytanoyl-CoA dioxygenase (PhyH)
MKKLTAIEIEQFIDLGYLKIENAFSEELAAQCRSILWKAIQLDPNEPASWTQPVIRLGEIALEPFLQAANTPALVQAFYQLAGDNWLPKTSLGSFPVRFPSKAPAGDTGWHVDASFPGDDPNNYMDWRINVHSKGRALLMLFLFSDVTEDDAPTLIRERSHLDIAKLLSEESEDGLSFMQLAEKLDDLPRRNVVSATGKAGTVYLCHPFIVHAAQEHRGANPKFMAQPALSTKTDFNIWQSAALLSPVEEAILKGIK